MSLRTTIAFILIIGIASAATYYVPDDYPTIQGAINACVDGDVVIVRPGTYVENIDFVGKAITVQSEQGAAVTTIDGNQAGSVVTFQCGEGAGSVLEGFTVTNGNSAVGGGIFCADSSPTIIANAITANSVSALYGSFGGGIYCTFSSATITNNTITGNTATGQWGEGGGIYCYGDPTITNNTITWNSADSKGGGIYCYDSWPTVTNTILWDNSAPTGKEISLISAGDFTISYSDVYGGQSSCYVDPNCTLNWGSGMIDSNPLFADSPSNDVHLTWPSPCRNTGDNPAVITHYDFEGDPRISYGTVDMGADEFHTHLYHIGTVTPGSPIEVKVVGDPGVTPVTLALGSVIQDPPQSTPFGDLYLLMPPIKTFNLGGVPSNGACVMSANVPTTWQSGEQYPFQALVGPLAPGSVLTNLMTLEVE